MGSLIIASCKNSAKKPSDASGAFVPWAQKYAREIAEPGARLALVDLVSEKPLKRSARVNKLLETSADKVIFFGHGFTSGLQTGHIGEAGIRTLGKALTAAGTKELILFACTFMSSPLLPLLLEEAKTLEFVWGHTRAGHTTQNKLIEYKRKDAKGNWVGMNVRSAMYAVGKRPLWRKFCIEMGEGQESYSLKLAENKPLCIRMPGMSIVDVVNEVKSK